MYTIILYYTAWWIGLDWIGGYYTIQVLGQTLSRLARGQVAEAWKAELKAREHETRLLEELEVSLPPFPPLPSRVIFLIKIIRVSSFLLLLDFRGVLKIHSAVPPTMLQS